jgi:hypothetical protein
MCAHRMLMLMLVLVTMFMRMIATSFIFGMMIMTSIEYISRSMKCVRPKHSLYLNIHIF